MAYSHENQVGAQLAAALVNAPEGQNLEALLQDFNIREPMLDAKAEQGLHTWAGELRPAFAAQNVDERCTAINSLLDSVAGTISLTTHDGSRPHLHLFPEGDDVLSRVKAVTAGGLALFMAWSGGERIGSCARATCFKAFVDNSKAGRQRYCSARCGNTDAVARHRQAANKDASRPIQRAVQTSR
ncbi:CGNR zinc finger domain-containing protein [Arthrobacter sp. R4-81]